MAIKSKEIVLNKLIFGLLIVALPLGQIIRISLNEIAVNVMDIGVLVAVCAWLLTGGYRLLDSRLTKPLSFFLLMLVLSLIINISNLNINEAVVSSLYLIRFFSYSLLYLVILHSSSLKQKIDRGMLIGGAIILFLGLVQYFLYPDLRNLRYAGWDEHLYRMFTWTFLDPNFAGIFFVLFLLFVLDKLFIKRTLFLNLISILALIAVVLTFSRSAYVALMAGLLVLFFLKGRKLASLGILGLFIFLTVFFVLVSPKSEGTNLLRIASGEARFDSVKNALTIFKDHPIFGVGFNSYRYAQRRYGFLDESETYIHSAAGTDNSFLFVLATSGVVGFGVFLYLWFRIFSIGDSLIKASVFALLVNSFFINSLFYPSIMLWMWMLVGLRENT